MKRIDAGKQFWADFPMVGYNADNLFIDVNMFHFSLGNGQPEDFQFTQLPLGPASAFGKPAPPSQPGEGDFRPGVDSLLIISKVAAAAWRDNSLVVAQTIGHPQGGLNTNAVRWYEIDTAGPKPQLQYFGTIFRRVGGPSAPRRPSHQLS